jgi:hypothetical protein
MKVKKSQVLYHGLGHLLWRILIQLKTFAMLHLIHQGVDHEMDPSPTILLGVTSHISKHTTQLPSTHELTIDFPGTQNFHLTLPSDQPYLVGSGFSQGQWKHPCTWYKASELSLQIMAY